MVVKNKEKIKGVSSATAVAFLQGFEGVFFTFLGLFFAYSIYSSPGFGVGALTIKELFTFGILFIIVKPKKVFELLKKSVINRDTRKFLFAGIFGTTFGNLCYLLSIQMGGVGYGAILTSLYPIFSMLLVRLFLKEKTTRLAILGMAIAVIASVLFTLLPALIHGNKFGTKKIVGIVLGACAALFWGLEGLWIHDGMQKKSNKSLKSADIVVIRSLGTTITTVLLLCPLFSLINLADSSWVNPYKVIGELFTTPWALLILVGISINLVILRAFHVTAISLIGAKLTAIIDTNNFLVPPLMSIFLSFTNLTFYHDSRALFEVVDWWAWLLIIPILVGVYIVLISNNSKNKEALEKLHDL